MATTVVVHAAEQVLVESATTVGTAIGAAATGQISTVENSVAKEAIAATAETPSNLEEQLHDGLQVVATEVVKGAKSAVTTVEAHPELIAEGAVAVVLGAATLVQPELAAGEVALIGKMAADHAKQGAEKIAADTGSNVVKAISKDLADHASEQTAKEAKAKADAKADATGTKSDATPDPKTASPDPKTASPDPKTTSPDPKTAPPEAGATPVPVAADEAVKLDPKVPVVKDSKPIDATNANTHEDKTVSVEIASEPSNVSNPSSKKETKPEIAPPVSLKITIGADGEVKAVSKETNGKEMSKVVPVEAVAIKKDETVNTQKSIGTETKESIPDFNSKDDPLKSETLATEVVPASVPSADNTVAVPVATAKSTLVTRVVTPPITKLNAGPSEPTRSPSQDISTAPNPATITTVATAAIVAKTSETTTTTRTEPVPDIPMVTISQASLDDLHIKIDNMHEAIIEITKLLVLRLPNTPVSALPPTPSSPIPLSDPAPPLDAANSTSAPETVSKTTPETTPETTPDTPKLTRPKHHKRPSVLENISKILWPFGGPALPTSDAEPGLDTPNLVKAPVVTAREISGDVNDGADGGVVREILI